MTDKYFDDFEEINSPQVNDELLYGDDLKKDFEKPFESTSRENTNPTDEEKAEKHSNLEEMSSSLMPSLLTLNCELQNLKICETSLKNCETSFRENQKENYDDNDNEKIKDNNTNINNIDNDSSLKSTGQKKKHDKFSSDNLRRKCKNIILDCIFSFTNDKIRILYNNNIGKGICKKQLLKLDKIKLSSTNIKYNKEFLYKTLEDIFSDISRKVTSYPKDYNKNLIKSLKNEKDYEKKKYFQNLFNLTFLQCLNHFNEKKICEELVGMKNMSKILDGYSEDQDYLDNLKLCFTNYESFINNTKSRKSRHEC